MNKQKITDEDIDNFLSELVELYHKHGLALSHEDEHGAFKVVRYRDIYVGWVKDAHRTAKYQGPT